MAWDSLGLIEWVPECRSFSSCHFLEEVSLYKEEEEYEDDIMFSLS